ncbi:hypothetical protein MUU53_14795 [Rhizobium lemnae]|uniref:Autophagy-related protein 16 domain-containing protein n=1 Tax=Rhizobium lemnae TaxID=1214924 RepID=A0ABV8E414_9HYPH|nr:hypothetical protein [Rhizobium lemnae]MCJ8509183.1 hypothetical protein [Rhizobium lemnae]
MIQFALLFGFGFLSAVLLVMILVPAVHRRVVVYTENRLKATMPISPSEVRAQRDMARAVYAAENARTKQELLQERDKAVGLQIRFDKLAAEASELNSSNHELQMQVQDMSTEAADLRSRLRREEGFIRQLKESLHLVETKVSERNETIEALERRIARLTGEFDDLRLNLSARETEIESSRLRATALREERDTLRMDTKLLTTRAKDAEMRFQEAERKLARLEKKLARETAAKADLETRLQWREQELDRMRTARNAGAEVVQPVTGNYPLPRKKLPANARKAAAAALLETTDDDEDHMLPVQTLESDLRSRSSALTAQLTKAKTKKAQDAVRAELAAIAADMVALTAVKDGNSEELKASLLAAARDKPEDSDDLSLAERAAMAIDRVSPAPTAD